MGALRRVPTWGWGLAWIALAIGAMDWWNWGTSEPLYFGWLPAWVTYQILFQVLLFVHLVLYLRFSPCIEEEALARVD